MPGVPDADGRAIGLNLIDVLSLDPDALHLHGSLLGDDRLLRDRLLLHDDRLLNDDRLLYDDRGRNDRRRRLKRRMRQRMNGKPADDTADEARPEIASSAAPPAAGMMPAPSGTAGSPSARPASMRAGPCDSRKNANSDSEQHFFHSVTPFVCIFYHKLPPEFGRI